MISETVLPFKLAPSAPEEQLTGFAGLPLFLETSRALGMKQHIQRLVRVREQGYSETALIESLVLLNLAGGDCVQDLALLRADEGLRTLLKTKELPSSSSVFRFLDVFHNEEAEAVREEGKAFIPARLKSLQGLMQVNARLSRRLGQQMGITQATLDMDASVVESQKREALYCYTKEKGYQPFQVYWAELGTILWSEFRDGNVPAGHGQLRLLQESLDELPDTVSIVAARSDSAGYQHDFLTFCEHPEKRDERYRHFGRIQFAVTADMGDGLRREAQKATDWKPLGSNGEYEWSEVCYVPSGEWKRGKAAQPYRYLVTRRKCQQPDLFENHPEFLYYGLVTNREEPGDWVLEWSRKRSGRSESAHGSVKSELSGGTLPSKRFGANAAWWQIAVIAFNLQVATKRLSLPQTWETMGMKALRFHLICMAGRVIRHARRLYLRLTRGHPVYEIYENARLRIGAIQAAGAG